MGAQHSLQYGVTQEDLELVAGPECVADEVWLRLEQATIVAPKKDPRNALDKVLIVFAYASGRLTLDQTHTHAYTYTHASYTKKEREKKERE